MLTKARAKILKKLSLLCPKKKSITSTLYFLQKMKLAEVLHSEVESIKEENRLVKDELEAAKQDNEEKKKALDAMRNRKAEVKGFFFTFTNLNKKLNIKKNNK